jgi:hypothetical protein
MRLHARVRSFNELLMAGLIEVLDAPRRRQRVAPVAPTLVALLFAAPPCHGWPADEAIPIRITPGESVTVERTSAKGDDVFALTG